MAKSVFRTTSLHDVLLMVLLTSIVGIVFLVVGVGFSGCTDNSEAVHAAETMGFKDPVVTNNGVTASFHGCSEQDGAFYYVTATNPAGNRVNLVVCCGGPVSFKGCTVRTR